MIYYNNSSIFPDTNICPVFALPDYTRIKWTCTNVSIDLLFYKDDTKEYKDWERRMLALLDVTRLWLIKFKSNATWNINIIKYINTYSDLSNLRRSFVKRIKMKKISK